MVRLLVWLVEVLVSQFRSVHAGRIAVIYGPIMVVVGLARLIEWQGDGGRVQKR